MDEIIQNLENKVDLKTTLESALLLPPTPKINESVMKTLLQLSHHDSELIDLAVRILKRDKLLVPKQVFILALESLSDAVRSIALDQFYNQDYQKDVEILHKILDLVVAGSISISTKASNIFVQVARNQDCNIFYFEFQDRLKQRDLGAVEQARMCNLVARLAVLSPESLNALDKLEATKFARDFSAKDMLLALNMIEIFTEIAGTSSGYEFLKKTGILDQFSAILDGESGLLVRAVIKFWGLLMFSNPEQCNNHLDIVSKLMEYSQDLSSKASFINLGRDFSLPCQYWIYKSRSRIFRETR